MGKMVNFRCGHGFGFTELPPKETKCPNGCPNGELDVEKNRPIWGSKPAAGANRGTGPRNGTVTPKR